MAWSLCLGVTESNTSRPSIHPTPHNQALQCGDILKESTAQAARDFEGVYSKTTVADWSRHLRMWKAFCVEAFGDYDAAVTLERLLIYFHRCIWNQPVMSGKRKGTGRMTHDVWNKHASALKWLRVRRGWCAW